MKFYFIVFVCIFTVYGCKSQTKKLDKVVNKYDSTAIYLLVRFSHDTDSLHAALYWEQKAINLDKLNYNLYKNKSSIECRLRNYTEAINNIDTALEIKKDFAELKSAKGFILEKMNRHEDAIKLYNSAMGDYRERLKKDSTNIHSLIDMAVLTILIKNKNDGLIEYEKICRRYPDDRWIPMMHDFFYNFNREDFIKSFCEP